MRRSAVLSSGAVVLVLLAGCAAGAEDDVRAVATAFEDAERDPQERCALLAPVTRATLEADEGTDCAAVIDELPLPGGGVAAVEVWGGEALVRIGGDVVFLTETGNGWRVTAAGCRPREERPYDCEVEGA